MAFLNYLVVILFFWRSYAQECAIKITSCAEIKTAKGFNFSHVFPGGSTITVIRHQILIAHGRLNPPSFNFTPDVRSMDNASVVTVACEDLRIEATHRHGRYIIENCVDFRIIDKVKPADLEGEVTPQGGYFECSVKNVSCTDIKTAEGFKFSHGISGGSTVTAVRNQIPIAFGQLSQRSFNYTPDVINMDNVSIVTRACENLTIQVTHRHGRHIRESCVDFRINEEEKPPEDKAPSKLGCIIGVSAVGALVLMACLCCIHWKRKEKKKNGVARFPVYIRRFLRKCGQEQKPESVFSVEEGDNGDSASQQDGSSDEDENGQNDNPQESALIPTIDPEAGGGTALMLCLNHNFSNGGIQPSTNGCISHSVVASGSNDQTVNLNVKDDPGGTDENEGNCRKMYSGRTCGGQSPEGHENEDEPLLLKPSCQEELYEPPPPPPHCRFEGPAIQVSDMTGGKAVVWWTRHGSDPAPTGGCSAAPDTEVDSAPNMKQN